MPLSTRRIDTGSPCRPLKHRVAADDASYRPPAPSPHPTLTPPHDRAALYRSTLEGISVAMARNLAGLQVSTGVPLTRVTAVGGGQRSPLWRRIMADALGLPLTESPVAEASAMGAAMLAMTAAGAHASVPDAARAMSARGATTEPDAATHALYQELGDLQAECYARLAGVFEAQHAFAQRHPLGGARA